MDETRLLAAQFEAHRRAAAGGRLPHARLAERGRRRRPGGLAAAQPRRRRARVENLGGWLTTVVAPDLPGHAASRAGRGARSRWTPHVPDPTVQPATGRRDPEQRGAAGRLGRARRCSSFSSTLAPPTAGVRAARHVRGPVRRDRAHRRALADRGPAARQPRPPPGAGRSADARSPTCARQRQVVDAFLAAARGGDFEALVAVLDPERGPSRRCCVPRSARSRRPGRRCCTGARTGEPARRSMFSRLSGPDHMSPVGAGEQRHSGWSPIVRTRSFSALGFHRLGREGCRASTSLATPIVLRQLDPARLA